VTILKRDVPFSQIVSANHDPHHYVTEQLIAANNEFQSWAYVSLSRGEVLEVWLPAHKEAGLPEGSVAAAVAHFRTAPADFQCRQLILSLIDNSCPVFLKQSSKAALEHLDGYHRLIAWGSSGREPVMAYVAGHF